MHPFLTLLILTLSLNKVLPAIKQSIMIDLTVKIPVPGNHLDYPVGLDLFSCFEKSVLKLRHWIKVSRTVFEACGWVQPHWGAAVLVIKVSAVTAPVALLLPPSKTQISTQCMTLCYVSLYCPISISVSFLASPPAPCWMEHSGDSVPSWEWGDGACKNTFTPTRTSRNSFMPLS